MWHVTICNFDQVGYHEFVSKSIEKNFKLFFTFYIFQNKPIKCTPIQQRIGVQIIQLDTTITLLCFSMN